MEGKEWKKRCKKCSEECEQERIATKKTLSFSLELLSVKGWYPHVVFHDTFHVRVETGDRKWNRTNRWITRDREIDQSICYSDLRSFWRIPFILNPYDWRDVIPEIWLPKEVWRVLFMTDRAWLELWMEKTLLKWNHSIRNNGQFGENKGTYIRQLWDLN